MSPKHLLMMVGLAVSASLALLGDKTPVSDTIAPAVARPVGHPQGGATGMVVPLTGRESPRSVMRIQAREELIGNPRGGVRATALFGALSWAPPAPRPQSTHMKVEAPPAAPTLPYTYIGKMRSGTQWEVYLTKGDATYIAKVGGRLDGAYRIESISPPQLILTYLPLNELQSINIGGAD